MEENKKNQNNKDVLGWVAGLEVFAQISSWIAFPIITAMIAGKALDTHYGTKPLIFLMCAAFGFLISAYGIIKVVLKYSRKIEENNINKNTDKNINKEVNKEIK